jgi:SAM-dependent methyltransferase
MERAQDPIALDPAAGAARLDAALERLRVSYAQAEKRVIACPACASAEAVPLVDGDRHGLGLTTRLCRQCGLGYLSPRPDAEWFARFYRDEYWPVYIGSRFASAEDMYERDQTEARAAQILDRVLPMLPGVPRSALDLGCGQGALLADLRRRLPGIRQRGLEPSADGRAFCRARHGIEAHPGPIEAFVSACRGETFELVTAIHVLEHTLDPNAFLAAIKTVVDADGYVYVEVPDLLSEAWQGIGFFHIAHTLSWSAASLARALESHGFEVVAFVHGAAEIWPWAVGALARPIAAGASRSTPPLGVPVEDIVRRVRLRTFGA